MVFVQIRPVCLPKRWRVQAFVPTLVAAGRLLWLVWCFFVMICRHINPFSIFQTTSIRLDMVRYCIAKGFFNEYGEITIVD